MTEILEAVGTDLVEVVRTAFARAIGSPAGPDDDFFGLGGNSLSSMMVVSDLQDTLGVDINPSATFLHPTARLLAAAIGSGEVVEAAAGVVVEHYADRVALTPVQEGQLLIAPRVASRGYLSWLYQLNGRLDAQALARAVDDVVRRHDVLRGRFERRGDRTYQYVVPFAPGVLRIEDVSSLPKADAIEAAVAAAVADFDRTSLFEAPHFQATLYLVAPKTHVFTAYVAEALVDGESGDMIAAEISRRYAEHAGVPPRTESEEPDDTPFLDHVRRNPPAPAAVARATAHWQQLAAAAPPEAGWPLPELGRITTATFDLSAAEWDAVGSAAQVLRSTPYAVVLASYQAALARVTGVSRLLLTTVVSDRSDPATERMVGSFHSVVRLDARVEDGEEFADLVARTSAALGEAIAHSVVPAPLAEAAAGGGPALGPMAGVHFYLFESHDGPAYTGVRRRRFRLHSATPEALRLNCTVSADGSRRLFFASTTVPEETLEQLSSALRTILATVPVTPDAPVDPAGA